MPAVWCPGCAVLHFTCSWCVPQCLFHLAFSRGQGPEQGTPCVMAGPLKHAPHSLRARPPHSVSWTRTAALSLARLAVTLLRECISRRQTLRNSRATVVVIKRLSRQHAWTEAPACSAASRVCLTHSAVISAPKAQPSQGAAGVGHTRLEPEPAPLRDEHVPAGEEPREGAGRRRMLTAGRRPPLPGPERRPSVLRPPAGPQAPCLH